MSVAASVPGSARSIPRSPRTDVEVGSAQHSVACQLGFPTDRSETYVYVGARLHTAMCRPSASYVNIGFVTRQVSHSILVKSL